MKTYQQLWQSLTPTYEAGEAQAIVRMVLETKYGMSLADMIGGKVNELSADERIKLEEIVERLRKAEPVQYVLGEAYFAGREFHVEPGVLIPRPETAELCQWIAEDWKQESKPKLVRQTEDSSEKQLENSPEKQAEDSPKILDLCTGSGCIAITLALDLANVEVTGWDISEDALCIAQANAKHLGAKNIKFEYKDALTLPKDFLQKWDTIVSNPPYICEKEKGGMEPNVQRYEPGLALFVPDEDPLRFYRAIAQYAAHALKPDGSLYFEINPLYEQEMRKMMTSLSFAQIETRKDAFGKKRMMKAYLNKA